MRIHTTQPYSTMTSPNEAKSEKIICNCQRQILNVSRQPQALAQHWLGNHYGTNKGATWFPTKCCLSATSRGPTQQAAVDDVSEMSGINGPKQGSRSIISINTVVPQKVAISPSMIMHSATANFLSATAMQQVPKIHPSCSRIPLLDFSSGIIRLELHPAECQS